MNSPRTIISSRTVKTAATTLLAIAALASQPAFASGSINPKQVTVQYQDLNLNSSQGKKKLEHRINVAVNVACNIHSTRSLSERRNMNLCKAKAIKNAYGQLATISYDQNVKLAAIHNISIGN